MARMKFLCDAERCIDCNACVTACNNEHDVPWGINRRHVVTLKDGESGEKSVSVACMHCTDAPCAAVCPVDCFYFTPDGIVLHDKDLCIGCGICVEVCPEVFEMDDDDKAQVKMNPIPPEAEGSCRKAVDQCPVTAIKIDL